MVSAQAGAMPGWWKPRNTRMRGIIGAGRRATGGSSGSASACVRNRHLRRRRPARRSPAARRASATGRARGRRQREGAEGAAVQRLDAVADGGQHALDLVVLALEQRQPQRALAGRLAGRGAHRLRVVVEHHAGEQALDLLGVDRMLGSRPRRPSARAASARSGGGSARRRRSAAARRWCPRRAGRWAARRARAAAPAAGRSTLGWCRGFCEHS